jgi:hypothetical protein
MPEAAASNSDIFWDQKNGKRPRTLGEIYQEMRRRLESRAKTFGLNIGGGANPMPVQQVPGDASVAAAAPGTGAATTAPTTSTAVDTGRSGKGYAGSVQGTGSVIPVANQPAGVPTAGSVPAGSASAGPAAAAATGDPAVSAAGAGFQPSAAKSLQAQQQYQRESSAEAFAPLAGISKEILGVNKSQLDVMIAIRDILAGQKQAAAQGAAATENASTASAGASRGPARPAPVSPVSMTKGQFV